MTGDKYSATHLTAEPDPENWHENPAPTPEKAVEQFWAADYTRVSECLNPKTITLYGCTLTSEPAPRNERWEYYIDGDEWCKFTGETITLRGSLKVEVVE